MLANSGVNGCRIRLLLPLRAGQRILAWICLLAPVAAAKGQDALYNALSLETSSDALTQTLQQPDQPHLGPVQFNLGAYAGVSYSDNINGSQTNAQADVISQAGVNLGLDWPATAQSDLQFGTGLGYVHYLDNPVNNGLVVSPNSALTYSLSLDEVVLTFYDQISYTRQVTTEAALANVATLPLFGNTTGAKVEWDPGQWTFQTSYGHGIYFSDGAHEYLNHSSENFFGRAGWRFAPATQAGLEASGSFTSYQVGSQSDNTSYSLGGYAVWQLRPSVQLTLRGGPTFYEFSSQGQGGASSTLNSYYVSFEISHQLTDFLSHRLQVNRQVQLGLNPGSAYIEQLSASYSVAWALTSKINLDASVNYDDGRQPFIESFFGFPIETMEDYQLYSGSIQASWSCTSHWSASCGYTHSLRNSNLPDQNYSANSVSFQLEYRF